MDNRAYDLRTPFGSELHHGVEGPAAVGVREPCGFLSGLARPTEGHVSTDGQDVTIVPAPKWPVNRIGPDRNGAIWQEEESNYELTGTGHRRH